MQHAKVSCLDGSVLFRGEFSVTLGTNEDAWEVRLGGKVGYACQILDRETPTPWCVLPVESDGPKLVWGTLAPLSFSLKHQAPVPYGVLELRRSGNDVVCMSWRRTVCAFTRGEEQWRLQCPGDEGHLCVQAEADGEPRHVFVFSGNGLHCLEASTGREVWFNGVVQRPRAQVEVCTWQGDIFYLGGSRLYRLAVGSGTVLESFDLPFESSSRAVSPRSDCLFIWDGCEYLGDRVEAGGR